MGSSVSSYDILERLGSVDYKCLSTPQIFLGFMTDFTINDMGLVREKGFEVYIKGTPYGYKFYAVVPKQQIFTFIDAQISKLTTCLVEKGGKPQTQSFTFPNESWLEPVRVRDRRNNGIHLILSVEKNVLTLGVSFDQIK